MVKSDGAVRSSREGAPARPSAKHIPASQVWFSNDGDR